MVCIVSEVIIADVCIAIMPFCSTKTRYKDIHMVYSVSAHILITWTQSESMSIGRCCKQGLVWVKIHMGMYKNYSQVLTIMSACTQAVKGSVDQRQNSLLTWPRATIHAHKETQLTFMSLSLKDVLQAHMPLYFHGSIIFTCVLFIIFSELAHC